MQFKIHTQEVAVSPEEQAFLQKKVERLLHLADRLTDESTVIRMDLVHESVRRPEEAFAARVTFAPPHAVLHAEGYGSTLENATDAVVDKLRKQIEHYKDKEHHMHERKEA